MLRKPPAKKGRALKTASGTEEAEFAEISPGFLHAARTTDSPKRAWILVNLIGESVVQVKNAQRPWLGFRQSIRTGSS